MRQLVYTIFISNNCTSFHLWWKKKLVKHRKISKYYEIDCRSLKLLHLETKPLSSILFSKVSSNPWISYFAWKFFSFAQLVNTWFSSSIPRSHRGRETSPLNCALKLFKFNSFDLAFINKETSDLLNCVTHFFQNCVIIAIVRKLFNECANSWQGSAEGVLQVVLFTVL